jgi:hypothetical protein
VSWCAFLKTIWNHHEIFYLLLLAAIASFTLIDTKPTLYIIGDSTVKNGDGTGKNANGVGVQ